jgi:hypothetical protein
VFQKLLGLPLGWREGRGRYQDISDQLQPVLECEDFYENLEKNFIVKVLRFH